MSRSKLSKFNAAKLGDPVYEIKAPNVPAWFKMLGHDGYIVITYEHPDGSKRDAIVPGRDIEMKDVK